MFLNGPHLFLNEAHRSLSMSVQCGRFLLWRPVASLLPGNACVVASGRTDTLAVSLSRPISTSLPVQSSKKMIRRDKKRRAMVAEYEFEKLRLKAIVKNKLLPEIVQVKAREDMAAHPKDSSIARLRNRCVLTGRPRGVIREYGLCRMKFRDLADHGYISGMTRSSW